MEKKIQDMLQSEDLEMVELALSTLTCSPAEIHLYIMGLVNKKFAVYPTEHGWKVAFKPSFGSIRPSGIYIKDPTKLLKIYGKNTR